jgi:hypothetical protein
MLDEGKITQSEYDLVKKELLEAPADDWEIELDVADPEGSVEESDGEGEAGPSWRAHLGEIPTRYRAALVVALVVLVAGMSLTGGDAAGTVTALPNRNDPVPAPPPEDSLDVALSGLAEGWNTVSDPPAISGGITTAPEPGPLDSFIYRFNDSVLLAGAYDPVAGYVYAILVRSNLQYEPTSILYVHLCSLLHPGSQECLTTFIEETGMFGRSHQELIGADVEIAWEFEGNQWRFEVAGDTETIRVQAPGSP